MKCECCGQEIKSKGTRTLTQNQALHLWFQLLADTLNDSGLDMRVVFEKRPEVERPWTKEAVKEYLWKPIQKAMTGKASTTQLDKIQPGDVYEVLNRHLSDKLGVSVPWPSQESAK